MYNTIICKIVLLTFVIVGYVTQTHAQVTLGGNTEPKKGAVLDMNANYKGTVLLPNVSLAGATDLSGFSTQPADAATFTTYAKGSMVYNTNDAILEGIGLYYWGTDNGTDYQWKRIGPPICCTESVNLKWVNVSEEATGVFKVQLYVFPKNANYTIQWFYDGTNPLTPDEVNGNVYTFISTPFSDSCNRMIKVVISIANCSDKEAEINVSSGC